MKIRSVTWRLWLLAAMLAGAVLRLVWVGDMEYKADEKWVFAATREYERSGALPRFGNLASVGVPNPGPSVWVFAVPARLFGLDTPTKLVRLVEGSAIGSFLLLLYFALRWVEPAEREPWLWAIALAAVNPLAVLTTRKIWTPSILPLSLVVSLMGWWRRDTRVGALVWGLAGIVIAQVHLSGAALLAGFAGWAWRFDRRRVRWKAWIAGVALGGLPIVPWLASVLHGTARVSIRAPYADAAALVFWRRLVLRTLGVGLDYSLGPLHRDFLAQPTVAEHHTFLVLAALAATATAGGIVLMRAAVLAWRMRATWRHLVSGSDSPTTFATNAAVIGVGLAFAATGVRISRHYVDVVFPLSFVWIAWLACLPPRRSPRSPTLGRVLLTVMCVSQLVISIAFLGYIHAHGGAARGDYGVAYGAQPQAARPVVPLPPE